MSCPRLYYFNSYGRAEVIRQILAVAEVDYEDFRFRDWDDWLTHKPGMDSALLKETKSDIKML